MRRWLALLVATFAIVAGAWEADTSIGVVLLAAAVAASAQPAAASVPAGAGTLVFPYVADFYATRNLPPFHLVAGLQVARSLLFLAFAIPLLRRGPRHALLLLALAFAVIASIAPLVMDNPYMPADIRFYHAIETGTSTLSLSAQPAVACA